MQHAEDHIMITPADYIWIDGPASLPKGAQMMKIEGDPKDSGLFTIRLKLPAGYRIMPHSHTAAEHVTVIDGTFLWVQVKRLMNLLPANCQQVLLLL